MAFLACTPEWMGLQDAEHIYKQTDRGGLDSRVSRSMNDKVVDGWRLKRSEIKRQREPAEISREFADSMEGLG
jgi:hypothetical protein